MQQIMHSLTDPETIARLRREMEDEKREDLLQHKRRLDALFPTPESDDKFYKKIDSPRPLTDALRTQSPAKIPPAERHGRKHPVRHR